MDKKKIVVILGPTATGKSSLAIELSPLFNAEIINADSMQVYKHMDIGTAKPGKDERALIPHHLIDIAEPDEDYTAARFRKEAADRIEEIASRGKNVIVAGGTGLYIKALTRGLFEGPPADKALREALKREAVEKGAASLYERLMEADPIAARAIHPNNIKRVIRALEVCYSANRPMSAFQKEHGFMEEPYEALKIGLIKDRAELYSGIDKRVDKMMEEGLLEETQGLLRMGYPRHLKPMCALGYKELSGFLSGECGMAEAVALIKRNTRHYAKRQITWFKGDPEIRWFNPGQKNGIIALLKGFLH